MKSKNIEAIQLVIVILLLIFILSFLGGCSSDLCPFIIIEQIEYNGGGKYKYTFRKHRTNYQFYQIRNSPDDYYVGQVLEATWINHRTKIKF